MGDANKMGPSRTSPAVISITDLIREFNTADVDFLKYVPNELLTEEQITAKSSGMKIWLVKHRRTKKADRQNAKGIKEGRVLDYDFKKRDGALAKRSQAYMPFALKQDSVSNNSISNSAENSNTFSEENSNRQYINDVGGYKTIGIATRKSYIGYAVANSRG